MRICLVLEGCYPYVHGGVSTWMHGYIQAMPEHEFVLWVIGAHAADRGKFVYELPGNVVEVHEVFLDDALRLSGEQEEADFNDREREALRRLVSLSNPDWDVLFDIFQRRRVHPLSFLQSRTFMDIFRDVCLAEYPYAPFADAFHTMRSMLLPVLYLLGSEVPVADVYHAISTGYGGLLACLGSSVHQAPVLLTEHGIYTREREEEIIRADWVVPSFKDRWIRFFYLLSEEIYRRAFRVTSLFHNARKTQIDMGCDADKCLVIPNGIQFDRFKDIPLKPDDGWVDIGAVVRLAPIKDVKTMIYAFFELHERLPKVRLHIMGGVDDEEYGAECHALVDTLGVRDLIFTGRVNVVEYMEKLDFTILTSISEGQPLSVLESLAARRPCVTTEVGCCRELLEGAPGDDFGVAGFVTPPMYRKGLADSMERMCTSRARRIEMGERGQRRVATYFLHEQMLANYRALYDETAQAFDLPREGEYPVAGIGFELKRLFRRKGLFATMRAYGYAGIVCTGPMLLGVLLQVGILVLCGLWGVGRANQDLLVCMVTYTLLASLTLTSFFSMPVTRFLADMLFAEREDEILPSFWGSNAIMLVAGTVLYGVFLLFSGATLLQGLLCLWLFNIMIVNWNGMSYLTAIKDYRGILCSFAAAIGVACLCALAALTLGLPPVEGLLASIALGYGVMLAWDVVLLYRYFPQSDRSPWRFLRWLDQFMPLALTGLFTNLGLFVHLVIIWAGPIGVQIKGLFYGAPYHDVPALIAFLTTLVTTVNFVVSVEVNFYPRYRDYYSLFNDGGVVGDIVVAEEEMLSTLNSELRFCALKQLFVTAAVISLETTVLSALPLGFNNLMHGYFRTLCVGYGLYAVGNTILLILLYFTDYKGAVLASGLFAGVAGLATAVSLLLPQQFYGFGFLLGAVVFFIVALLRLDTYTANLPYRILSQQPIVATDKTGRFTQLGRLLDRAEQRYEECRRKGVPHGAFQRAVVRVYRNHWGGSDDR